MAVCESPNREAGWPAEVLSQPLARLPANFQYVYPASDATPLNRRPNNSRADG